MTDIMQPRPPPATKFSIAIVCVWDNNATQYKGMYTTVNTSDEIIDTEPCRRRPMGQGPLKGRCVCLSPQAKSTWAANKVVTERNGSGSAQYKEPEVPYRG